jgi:hypothetical protein
MAQFSTKRNNLLNNNDTLYEVVMIAGQSGPSVYVPEGNLNGSTDAFGRLRQSTPYTLFDSHNLLSKNNKFDESTSGSGSVTYNTNESAVLLNVSDADGDEVVRQSYRHFSYQPGKSLLVLNTFVMNETKENLRQRVGYFDTENGIYLEQDGEDLYLVLRSNVSGTLTETRVVQDNWSVNKLNSYPINLDISKSQIMWIDLEWLGVGSVRTGFVINGQFVLCHIFHNANINPNVYMTTPNLPIRYEITNTGTTSGNSTMKQICSTVASEGGYEARARQHVVGTASLAGASVNTAFESLVTIRMKRSGPIVVPAGADILNVANTDFEWALFRNATPSSSLTYVTATDNVEYSLTNVTFSSTGERVAGGYMGGKTAPVALGDGGFDWDYQLGETIAGVSDTFTLAARAKSNSSAVAGILKWFEL